MQLDTQLENPKSLESPLWWACTLEESATTRAADKTVAYCSFGAISVRPLYKSHARTIETGPFDYKEVSGGAHTSRLRRKANIVRLGDGEGKGRGTNGMVPAW